MDKNQERIEAEAAFHRLAILTQLLESDPEIIGSLTFEQVGAELLEMGIDPQSQLNITELRAASGGAIWDTHGLGNAILSLFETARDEIFEDGMESEFSKRLDALVQEHEGEAISALAYVIENQTVNEEVVAEALRWMGRLEHPSSYEARLKLLEHSLRSGSARVRDAGTLGLASMDDPHAIPFLRQAIRKETYPELREDMQQVLSQLENTR
jgi:hypothetical protein